MMDSQTITKLLLIAQSLITCSDAYKQSDRAGTLYSHPLMNDRDDLFTKENGLRVNEVEWGTSTSSYEDTADTTRKPSSRVKLFMERSNTARFYANHEGAHCVYSWYDDARNLTSTCGLGCKLNVQALNPIHNGKVPQTGIYVRAKLEELHGEQSNWNGIDTTYNENGFSQGLRSDRMSIVKCNNEFGCHANDMVDKGDIGHRLHGSGPGYEINSTCHDAMTGVRTVQPHGKHGASPALVRKSVCKCNMGFTAPLQLQSTWCGLECPGPDCALRTKTKELNEEWCDDLNDGKTTNSMKHGIKQQRCKLPDASMHNDPSRNPNMESSYMENFYAEQSETRQPPWQNSLQEKNVLDSRCEYYRSDDDDDDRTCDPSYTNSATNDISKSNLKSTQKGSAYNYYTTSERYAESDKFDDIAKKLYDTLSSPLNSDDPSFRTMTLLEKKRKKVDLKRFACR